MGKMHIRKKIAWLILSCVFLCLYNPPLFAEDQQNCLFCHKYQRLRAYDAQGTLHNFYVNPRLFDQSIHRATTCVGCHSDIETVPHAEAQKVDCTKVCHIDRWKALTGTAEFSHQRIANSFQKSIHAAQPNDPPEIAELKPDCKYCHLNDLFLLPEDVPSEKVLKRCNNCHKDEGLQKAFTHIFHRFKKTTSLPPLDIVELCASCHADKDFHNVVGFTGSQAEAVKTYKETIHYRILQFGGDDTPHCISCHASGSIHDIRALSDPQSSVHPDNRFKTCQAGECHPASTASIAVIDSHLSKYKDKGIELQIFEIAMASAMFSLLFILFTLMGMETYGRLRNRDARFFRWRRSAQPLTQKPLYSTEDNVGDIPNLHRYVDANPKGDYKRYSIHVLINHALITVTFIIAVLTGLPLFFHNADLSHHIISLMGGIDTTRYIHRINAIVFTINCFYHLLVLTLGTTRKILNGTFDIRQTQFPLLKDLKDFERDLRYFLGMVPSRPRMEKFMYKQKLHYLTMVWGSSVLIFSGCCLLFPEFMVNYLYFPKVTFNVLRLLHGEWSVLAFLVITIWHMYNVHTAPGRFPIQWTFWNGKITKDHQIEEHFLEYERQVKEGSIECEEDKLIEGESTGTTMTGRKQDKLEPFLVFIIIAVLSATLSTYVTFKIQFERRIELPQKRTKKLSYQTLRIKEQEREQIHDHFHLLSEDINLEAWENRSTCIICHSPYPHGRNLRATAVMNLHTEFMTCHSCHLKVAEGEEVPFGWIDPLGFASKAEPYGVRIDASSGLLSPTENHFSKLTPYRKIKSSWKPITSEKGVAIALRYMEEKETNTPEVNKAIEDTLHQGTELKEFIRCSRCHSKNGIINFSDLGFDPARTEQLQDMQITGILTDYDTFYFPEFFEEKFR
jgi:cytochrome b subunit of formate dehydrogenase